MGGSPHGTMKLLILLLSVSISSLLLLSVLTTTEGSAVYDTDGEKLVAGKAYDILIDPDDQQGVCHWGFSVELYNYTCPLTLSVHLQACDPAARFYPVNANDTFVQQYTDLNIEFPEPRMCFHDPPVWKLADADEATGRRYVTTGGAKGNSGADTVSNWFKIVRSSGKYYKLLYCPTVCLSCDYPCGFLGIYFENGKRWLGLEGEPFKVAFRKHERICPAILCQLDERGSYQV